MTLKWIEVAGSQAGAITRRQIIGAGSNPPRLLSKGLIISVEVGLYVMAGPRRQWETDVWLAILRSGSRAFACRRTAAALWELDGVERGALDVGVPVVSHPRRGEVVRLRGLVEGDLTTRDGMPITSVARTLRDLGAVATSDVVERAVESALRRRLVTVQELVVPASARSVGSNALREVMGRRPTGAPPTESDAETIFLQIARRAGLPEPTRQLELRLRGRTHRLDFAWGDQRLATEIDGAATHGPGQLTSDLRRQNRIVLGGWTIVRFSWAMVVHEPEMVRRELLLAWDVCCARLLGAG